MISEVDVLVMGGGPAGSATAIGCARRGLRTMLFERQPFPREHAGETLHPGVETLLKSLGVDRLVDESGFLRHLGHWVSWNRPRQFSAFGGDEFGPWLGYQAWRADFDKILLDKARQLGVDVRVGSNDVTPALEGARVIGAHRSGDEIRSRYVIDATGSGHWLRRRLGLELRRFSPPLIAFYGYCAGECPDLDEAPVLEAEGTRWNWMARVRPALYQWTQLHLGGKADTSWATPEMLRRLTPTGRVRGADVTWRILPQAAGRGYFAVGDAGAVLDPASSHGVLRALMSGMMAAHLIGVVLQGGAKEQTAIDGYRDWLMAGFLRDVERLKELYRELSPGVTWLAGA